VRQHLLGLPDEHLRRLKPWRILRSAMPFNARVRRALSHPRLPLALALLVVLMALPSLGSGWVLDDYGLRVTALGLPDASLSSASRFDLFKFVSGDPVQRLRRIDAGFDPWWTSTTLRLQFFRPVTSITHWIDFQLWPDHPLPMHAVNVAIYVGVVLAALALYRRTLGATWIAGLAGLLYALDPGHAIPIGWVAARNALLAVLFGLLSLLAHDRARRDGWRPGTPLAALALALSLLSGEVGVGTLAYLAAHVLFLDPAPRFRDRARALAPQAVVAVAWVVAYKALGYGGRGSDMYLDPGRDPLEFVRASLVRFPILLNAAWGVPGSSIAGALSAPATVGLAVFAAAACALFARLLWPVLHRDPVARFFAVGMLLSVFPNCALVPNDRVLVFVGFGAFGLIARYLAEVLGAPSAPSAPSPRSARVLAWFLLVVHVGFAGPLYRLNQGGMATFARFSREPLDAILLGPSVPEQTAILVNPPACFFTSFLSAMRFRTARPVPLRWRCLAPGIYPVTLKRLGERAISARVEGGLVQTPGTWFDGAREVTPPFRWAYLAQHLNHFMRPRGERMAPGDRLALTGVTVEVLEVTEDGRPREVSFTFDTALDQGLVWLQWDGRGYSPLALPAVGASVTLPAAEFEM
jgi:hypothetical protein